MLSIQQMQYILTLSEEQQFQKASEKCFVTQPTLSMQIKKAEDTLGQFIFDRSTNPLSLTNFGKKLLPVIREILNENEKIKWLAEKQSGGFSEEIKMGIIPTVSSYLVPKMFRTWKSTLENVTLSIEEMKSEEILEAFEKKEIDVAIMAGPHYDPKLRTIPLFSEEILVYCPSIETPNIQLEDLHALHPWLLSKGNCLRTQMIHFCQIQTGESRDEWNYQGGNIELLIEMVNQNGGYTLIPENYSLQNGKEHLKKVESPAGIPAREIIALYPSRTIKQEKTEQIIREVQLAFLQQRNFASLNVLNWR